MPTRCHRQYNSKGLHFKWPNNIKELFLTVVSGNSENKNLRTFGLTGENKSNTQEIVKWGKKK